MDTKIVIFIGGNSGSRFDTAKNYLITKLKPMIGSSKDKTEEDLCLNWYHFHSIYF